MPITPSPSTPRAYPVPPHLRLAAAARLVGGHGPNQAKAARNLIEAAPQHGIDLDLFFAVRVGETLGPVCLVVLGSGKTAVLFISSPTHQDPKNPQAESEQEPEIEAARRGAAVRAAVEHLDASDRGVRVVQALPSPDEGWAISALQAGGLSRIATLTYLRRESKPGDTELGISEWPEGITVGPVGQLTNPESLGELASALDRSYEQTLDCPELCGLRETADVIESHKAAGQFDAALWRLVRLGGEPMGCCLLNRNPDLGTVELVYLGLSPRVRGMGLGRMLLADGIARVAKLAPEPEITCAVDQRNTPAVRMYERAGFTGFASKIAFIRGVGDFSSGRASGDAAARKV